MWASAADGRETMGGALPVSLARMAARVGVLAVSTMLSAM